jgi:hypothetical protein
VSAIQILHSTTFLASEADGVSAYSNSYGGMSERTAVLRKEETIGSATGKAGLR